MKEPIRELRCHYPVTFVYNNSCCITCCGLALVSAFLYKQVDLDLTTEELLTWSPLNFFSL